MSEGKRGYWGRKHKPDFTAQDEINAVAETHGLPSNAEIKANAEQGPLNVSPTSSIKDTEAAEKVLKRVITLKQDVNGEIPL